MKIRALSAAVFAATSGAAVITQPAWSQQSGGLEEIIVTATFRETNVQDTPIAITAVNAEMLDARGQTNVFEVAAQAPNVSLRPSGQSQGPAMTAFIRGVGQTDFIFAVEPGVGIYVDDVYYSTLTGSLLDLLDLDRVEVLRGPQGTLAGRNSIGGAIKMYSKAPGEDEGGTVQVTYGSYDMVEARATGDFTIVPDKWYARVSGVGRQRDGYVDVLDYGCLYPGRGVPNLRTSENCKVDEYGNQSYVAGRMSLRWVASDDVEVNFIGDLLNDDSGTAAGTLLFGDRTAFESIPVTVPLTINRPLRVDDGNPATPPVGYFSHQFVPYGPNAPAGALNDPYVTFATLNDLGLQTVPGPVTPGLPGSGQTQAWRPVRLDSANTLDMSGLSASVDWTMSDSLSLTSITAYREYDSVSNADADGSPVSIILVGDRTHHTQTSQEIRLNGSGEKVDWTMGFFYFDQDSEYEGRIDLPFVSLDFIHGPDPTPATTWAVFANTAWHLTDRFNLSAGVRYSDESKDYTHQRHNPDGTVPLAGEVNQDVGLVNGLSASFRDERVDYRVAMDHGFSDNVMGYVSVATGYKGGGVNPRPFFPEQLKAFDPETMTAYEIGFKSTLLDSSLRLNGAVFFNDYEDIQLNLNACEVPFSPNFSGPCAAPRNVGSAEVQGVELELEYRPGDALSIDTAFSYLDFEYTELRVGALGGNLSNVAPYTPERKWSAGLQYDFANGSNGHFAARLDAAYQSLMYGNPTNGPNNLIDEYTLVNARLTWTGLDEKWSAALELLNLTDELYYLTIFDNTASPAGHATAQPGLPYTWSLSLRHRF